MGKQGKSQPGDKTVLDAVEAVCRATQGLDDSATMLVVAEQAVTKKLF